MQGGDNIRALFSSGSSLELGACSSLPLGLICNSLAFAEAGSSAFEGVGAFWFCELAFSAARLGEATLSLFADSAGSTGLM